MARGFGTTWGSASTDIITSAVTTLPTTFSFWAWTYRDSDTNNRVFDKVGYLLFSGANLGLAAASWAFCDTSATWNYNWSGVNDAWRGMGLSLDRGSDSNNPTVYYNGSKLTVGSGLTKSGTPTYPADTNAWSFGNRDSDNARVLNGMLAEVAVWSVILDDSEFDSLNDGFSPMLIRPSALIEYIPMIRDNVDRKAAAPSVTGTAVQPHPGLLRYPRRKQVFNVPDQAPATTRSLHVVSSPMRW